MTIKQPMTIRLSMTQTMRQWSKLLAPIQVQVMVTKRHAPIAALLTYCGTGITITKRDNLIASVLGVRPVK
jgi:hypothetical protein